ncbi:MAG: DNA primase family protein [Acetobacterium sp.]
METQKVFDEQTEGRAVVKVMADHAENMEATTTVAEHSEEMEAATTVAEHSEGMEVATTVVEPIEDMKIEAVKETSAFGLKEKNKELIIFNEMVYLDESKLIPKDQEREWTIDCYEKVGFMRKINKKTGTEHFILMNINPWVNYVASVFYATYKTPNDEIALYNCELGKYDPFSSEKGGIGYNDLAQVVRSVFNYSGLSLWSEVNGRKTINALVLEIRKKVIRFNQGNYINCQNGVLMLETQELMPFSQHYFTTLSSEIVYDTEAKCPVFLEKLREIVEDDEEMVMMIQQIFGYAISNSMAANVAFWLFGTGRNGKSLIMSVLSELIGQGNVSHLPLKDFNEKFFLESCLNKRLNICDENKHVKNFDTAIFKSITTDESIHVTRKHINAINVQLGIKLIMLFNKPPEIGECTPALSERLIILPFNRTYYLDEADPFLKNKLLEELQGILNWSLQGFQQLSENGFKFPKCQACEEAKIEYFKENVPVLKFFVDRYEPALPSENKSLNRTMLFRQYNDWAYTENHITYSKEEYFYKALQEGLTAQGMQCEFRKSGMWQLLNFKIIENKDKEKGEIM